jgi:hypothetical protein
MIIEVYDDYKTRLPCVGKIQVHCMSSSRVMLTFGHRLETVYQCEDCGLSCIKLSRRTKEYSANTAEKFCNFICLQYDAQGTKYH